MATNKVPRSETAAKGDSVVKRQRCPEVAHEAIDTVLVAGFATLEQAVDAVTTRLAEASPVGELTAPDWIEVIKTHAGVDLASLQRATRHWSGYESTAMLTSHSGRPCVQVLRLGAVGDSYYNAAYVAQKLLDAENGFLKGDIGRIWRKLLREVDDQTRWKGRSRVSAFDWYVMLVNELTEARCRNRRGTKVVAK
jgi:hypothetical protein